MSADAEIFRDYLWKDAYLESVRHTQNGARAIGDANAALDAFDAQVNHRLPVLPDDAPALPVMPNPRSRELLLDVRTDAADYLRSANRRMDEGNYADALTELQIAEDRLQFAEQLQQELDLYVANCNAR